MTAGAVRVRTFRGCHVSGKADGGEGVRADGDAGFPRLAKSGGGGLEIAVISKRLVDRAGHAGVAESGQPSGGNRPFVSR